MLRLPPNRILDGEAETKYRSEILNACMAPTKSMGKLVTLTEKVRTHPKGTIGVARPFNPVDHIRLYEDYSRMLRWGDPLFPLPNMTEVYDFFFVRDGQVGVGHTHVSGSVISDKSVQLQIELD